MTVLGGVIRDWPKREGKGVKTSRLFQSSESFFRGERRTRRNFGEDDLVPESMLEDVYNVLYYEMF